MNRSNSKNTIKAWFRLCPVRHILLFLGGALIGAYFLLRSNTGFIEKVCYGIVRPYHRALSKFCSNFSFSAAGCLIAAAVIAVLAYVVYSVVSLIKKPEKGENLYRLIITLAAAFAVVYGGFCLLWGVYYDCADFEEQSGIVGSPISKEDLNAVTIYFTDKLNELSTQVPRNSEGQFDCDLDAVFERSSGLYANVEKIVPCLKGDALKAKPFMFSKCMSYINFTGFFFPFTAEANINVDSPECFVPSTIAHELAHQRGIAEEDEANFAAVLSCLESGDTEYSYSACLLAYIHLGNALYKADRDAWKANYERLLEGPLADLKQNNDYWAKFETPVNKVSDKVYNGFLQSYGQTEGLKTYGKCVDLLVAYYINKI